MHLFWYLSQLEFLFNSLYFLTKLPWVYVLIPTSISRCNSRKRFIFTASVTFLCYLIHQTKENGINSDIYIPNNFPEHEQNFPSSSVNVFYSSYCFLFFIIFLYLWDYIIFASLNEHHTHHRFFYTKCLDFSSRCVSFPFNSKLFWDMKPIKLWTYEENNNKEN